MDGIDHHFYSKDHEDAVSDWLHRSCWHQIAVYAKLRTINTASDLRKENLKALFSYWDKQRDDAFAPARRTIRPQEMKSLLPIVVLADVVDGAKDFRIRLMGTHVVDGLARDLTGRTLGELKRAPLTDLWMVQYRHAALTQQPVAAGPARGRLWTADVFIAESLALPLSSDGRSVDMILGGIVTAPRSAIGPLAR